MRLHYAKAAIRDLEKLARAVRERIQEKVEWYLLQEDPLAFAEPLSGSGGLFRYRVGEYRVIVQPDGTIITVLRIRKRSEAYR